MTFPGKMVQGLSGWLVQLTTDLAIRLRDGQPWGVLRVGEPIAPVKVEVAGSVQASSLAAVREAKKGFFLDANPTAETEVRLQAPACTGTPGDVLTVSDDGRSLEFRPTMRSVPEVAGLTAFTGQLRETIAEIDRLKERNHDMIVVLERLSTIEAQLALITRKLFNKGDTLCQ